MPHNPKAAKVMKRTRQLQAWSLRTKGWSNDDIAKELNVSRITVASYLKAILDETKTQVGAEAEDFRRMSLARLDELYRVAHLKAETGDLAAIEVCRKLEHERADLMGCFVAQVGPTGNTVNVTQNFSGLPTEELVEMARIRGIPVPAALGGREKGDGVIETADFVPRQKAIALTTEQKLLEAEFEAAEKGTRVRPPAPQSPSHVNPEKAQADRIASLRKFVQKSRMDPEV